MKQLILTTLILSTGARAYTCQGDADCLSASLSMIKKAVKLKACSAEVNKLVETIRVDASDSEKPGIALERCLYLAKSTVKAEKRLVRIKKALGQN